MRKQKVHRRLLWGIGIVLLCTILTLCLHGPLFPYSPMIVGFQQRASARADLYYHRSTDTSAFAGIDALIGEVEAFHGMHFQHREQLVACGSMQEYRLLTGGSKARMVTFFPYGRVLVPPRTLQDTAGKRIHADVYLKHELSHALLCQQLPLTRFNVLPVWLKEGLAVYSAGQLGCDSYPSKAAIRQYIQQGYFIYPNDCGKSGARMPEYVKEQPPFIRDARFWYSESACLVGDIIEQYGKDRFMQFVQLLLHEGTADKDFARVFGITIADYCQGFRQRMRQ